MNWEEEALQRIDDFNEGFEHHIFEDDTDQTTVDPGERRGTANRDPRKIPEKPEKAAGDRKIGSVNHKEPVPPKKFGDMSPSELWQQVPPDCLP